MLVFCYVCGSVISMTTTDFYRVVKEASLIYSRRRYFILEFNFSSKHSNLNRLPSTVTVI